MIFVKLVIPLTFRVDKTAGRRYITAWMIGVSSTNQIYFTFGDSRFRQRVLSRAKTVRVSTSILSQPWGVA